MEVMLILKNQTYEIINSKLQAPNKSQISNSKKF